ncbi:MAG TPA: HlyD family secretion protein [bacterium]|nr:HlyD family secretion protein [bacterium]
METHHPAAPKPWWRSTLAKNTGFAFLAAVALGVAAWFFAFRPYISTDDARVGENLVRVAPDGVGGMVLKVNVAEGDRVQQGQVLVELDHANYQSQLLKAQARATLAQTDFNRAERLFKQGAISGRDYQAAQANSQEAQADLQLAQNALDHTYLKSPVDGIVVEKTGIEGNLLEPGQTALTVADVDHAWVTANIQETSVGKVRPGQPVRIHLDEGGDLTGKVLEITTATASQFALLPAENASGNFIKLVQRIPIKVALDPHPDRVLKAGQSVEIKIKVN